MKLSVFSALLATLLVVVYSAEAHDASSSAMAGMRRHHQKQTQALQKRGKFSGKATWYGVNPGDRGACGGLLDANDFFVALNQDQYGSLNAQSPLCGKTITITNGLKTAQAKILDACPKGVQCHYGALDMSRALFSQFNDFGVGLFDITWWINGDGGDDDSSSSSSSSSNSKSDDDRSASEAAAKKKAAAEKAAEEAAAEKKAEEAAAEKKKQQRLAAEKKKEEAKEKKEKAEKKKKEEAKKKKAAAKKAAAAKVKTAQKENIAAFGQIMQTLNQMVESAVDPSTGAAQA